MKLILKEAIEDFNTEEPNDVLEVNAPLDIEVNEEIPEESIFIDETDPKLSEFVNSAELNELRDILIELPEDIHLLLLDNKCIVIARVDKDNETYLYCLGNDEDELSLIKMPMHLEEILANNQIIQYTPANISDVHEKVIELFAKELEPEENAEELISTEEPIEDIEIPEEEEQEYEENKISA